MSSPPTDSTRPARPFDLLLALSAPLIAIAFVLLRVTILALARLAGATTVPIGPYSILAIALVLMALLLVLARSGARRLGQRGFPLGMPALTLVATTASTALVVGWTRGFLSSGPPQHALQAGERIVGIATGKTGADKWTRGDDWIASRIGAYLVTPDMASEGHDFSCIRDTVPDEQVILLLADQRGESLLIADRFGWVARVRRMDHEPVCAPIDPERNPNLLANKHLAGAARFQSVLAWSALEDERNQGRGFGDVSYGAAVKLPAFGVLFLATLGLWWRYLGRRQRFLAAASA